MSCEAKRRGVDTFVVKNSRSNQARFSLIFWLIRTIFAQFSSLMPHILVKRSYCLLRCQIIFVTLQHVKQIQRVSI